MKRPVYIVIAGLAVAFIALRMTVGDWVGAFWSLAVLVLASAVVLAVVGFFASNIPDWSRSFRGISWDSHVKKLEESGKALREHYQTGRAATFEDLRTGCLVHLLDLGDRGLLCLYGQQYFDYEPIDDDPDLNQPRKFPTRSFSLLRRTNNGDVLELSPGPDVFEPTVRGAITRTEHVNSLGIQLKDGEIFPDVSFDSIEAIWRSLGTPAAARVRP
jgi:hypothetical protein